MYKNSNSFLYIYIFAVSCQFFKQLLEDITYKAKNWHALSHEQYFSTHRSSDICRYVFKTATAYKKLMWFILFTFAKELSNFFAYFHSFICFLHFPLNFPNLSSIPKHFYMKFYYSIIYH